MIRYDDTIITNNVPDDVEINCINCRKILFFLLYNQTIENFITPVVTNMVFQNGGLSWITQSNQKHNFYFQHHCYYLILNGPCYNTKICSLLHGLSFEDYVTTYRRDRYNIMCSIGAH